MSLFKNCKSFHCAKNIQEEGQILISGYRPSFKGLRESLVQSKGQCGSLTTIKNPKKISLRLNHSKWENEEPKTAADTPRTHRIKSSNIKNRKNGYLKEVQPNVQKRRTEKRIYLDNEGTSKMGGDEQKNSYQININYLASPIEPCTSLYSKWNREERIPDAVKPSQRVSSSQKKIDEGDSYLLLSGWSALLSEEPQGELKNSIIYNYEIDVKVLKQNLKDQNQKVMSRWASINNFFSDQSKIMVISEDSVADNQ